MFIGTSLPRVCAGSLRILRMPHPDYRRALFRDYIRAEFTPYESGAANRPGSRQLLGFRVEYYELLSYLTLLREIFVSDMYRFSPRRPDPLIFDCGSNIGMSILYFKHQYPHARVIGFEPDPRTFALLKRNVENNKLQSIELHNVALGKEDGEATFYFCERRPGWVAGSTLPIFHEADSSSKVPVRRVSSIIDGDVDLMKVDIEGAEHELLEDLAESGKVRNIREMMFEYHHHAEADDDSLAKFLSILEQHRFGYALASYEPMPFKARKFQGLLLYAYRKD